MILFTYMTLSIHTYTGIKTHNKNLNIMCCYFFPCNTVQHCNLSQNWVLQKIHVLLVDNKKKTHDILEVF